ncbi:asparagine synthase-domain-containing protein [Chlamydoabsidia padenii]|nr:asparagine synthase-domain-containing protein [Chlamydoabsidia padenii]
MCGILFSLSSDHHVCDQSTWDALKVLNTKRGPDAQQIRQTQCQAYSLRFFSSVLHLRGPDTVSQPLYNSTTGDIFSWNGEVFNGLEIPFGVNDTEQVKKNLEEMNSATDQQEAKSILLATMSKIEGPFAFVFWHERYQTLWFSRDCLGRRSLLWNRSSTGSFMLSSVGYKHHAVPWEEVPANGIYALEINSLVENTIFEPTLFPWKHTGDILVKGTALTLPFPRLNTQLATEHQLAQTVLDDNDIPTITTDMEKAIQQFKSILGEAVKRRVADVPHLGSSASSPRVAILFSGGLDCICLAALAHQHLPITEPIDLLNVAFENPRSEQAKQQAQKKAAKNKGMPQDGTSPTARSMYDTPDRLTGKAGVKELRAMAPDRCWNFVEINVPFEEAMDQKQRIVDLMYPLDTVMDLSIAMALWFASRGKGLIDTTEYTSHSRVLISGLGADEQLGGYSRHREAYKRGQWEELIKETQLDVDRIASRNLGRDDRIMSDHGKEVRFPFLDTDVVNVLCRLPIHLKMDMRFERGIGEKMILRHVARQLGLPLASRNWKRAIQFGAKTAKMTGESRTQKGQHKLK